MTPAELEQAVARATEPHLWVVTYPVGPATQYHRDESLRKARAAIATVRDALKEPTEEMLSTSTVVSDEIARHLWQGWIAASPLGREGSDG